MAIFQNAWFVGISTGVISGILVFFLTKWIMDKKGKVEYIKQVNNANRSVIEALKPYIADKGLPDIKIFEALISSTARAFCIEEKDMFAISVYCEELIKEIISDVYVSNEKKEEYTSSLAEYIKEIEYSDLEIRFAKKNKLFQSSGTYVEKISRQMSTYIALLTAGLGMLASFVIAFDSYGVDKVSFWYPFDENPIFWIPILLLLLVLLILVSIMLFELLLKSLKRHKELKDDVDLVEKRYLRQHKGSKKSDSLYYSNNEENIDMTSDFR